MPFLIYRDKMRAEGPNHYPYTLGMALNQYKIDTEAHYLHYITKSSFNDIFLLCLCSRASIEFLGPVQYRV